MLRIIPQNLTAMYSNNCVHIFSKASFLIISAYKYFVLLLFRSMFNEVQPNFAEIE